MSHSWGLDDSWTNGAQNNPFKFSRPSYAHTISSDGASSAPSTVSRYSSYFRRFRKPSANLRELSSLKSLRSGTTRSSSKSKIQQQPHRYYESIESMPSTASIPPLLPSTNLNPPKIVRPWYKTPLFWIKALSIVFLCTCFVASIKYGDSIMPNVELSLTNTAHSDQSRCVLLFIAWNFIALLLMLPQTMLIIHGCTLLVHAHGTLRGILITLAITYIVNFMASVVAYFYARFLLGRVVQSFVGKFEVLQALENTVFDTYGWKVVMLLRCLPLNTYNLLNYILGFTSLDVGGLIISSLGMLPNLLLCCLVASYADIATTHTVMWYTMVVQLVLVITVLVWWISWLYWTIQHRLHMEELGNFVADDERNNQLSKSNIFLEESVA